MQRIQLAFRKLRSFQLTLLAVVLASCGGGGGTNGEPPPQQNNTGSGTSIEIVHADGTKRALTISQSLNISSNCYIEANDFNVAAGSIQADPGNCGKFVGYTDAASGAYSIGRFEYTQVVSPNVTVSVTQRKTLGNQNRPVEVYFLGGAFAWAFDGEQAYYYIYESETHWTGWIATTQIKPNQANQATVHQVGRSIVVSINGNELDQFTLNSTPVNGKVSVFFKGDPNSREAMEFDEFVVLDSGDDSTQVSVNDDIRLDSAISISEPTQIEFVEAIEAGTANEEIYSSAIRRLTVKNEGNTTIDAPRLIALANSTVLELPFASPKGCSAVGTLAPGATCHLFARVFADDGMTSQSSVLDRAVALFAPTDSKAVPLATVTQPKVGIVSGSTVKPVTIRAATAKKIPNPKVNTVTPTKVRSGTKVLFKVTGTNLPTTLSLEIPKSTCENSTKPSRYSIYCTISAESDGRVIVYNDNSSNKKQIAAKLISIEAIPTLTKPLPSSYMTTSNVSLEFLSFNRYAPAKEFPNGQYHTGIDIMTAGANPDVYPIAKGTVIYNTTTKSYATKHLQYWNAFVVVDHGSFYAYYGHLTSNVSIRGTVDPMVPMGKIRDAYNWSDKVDQTQNHLHFSISILKDAKKISKGFGYQGTPDLVTAKFVNPAAYIGY